jgi:phosphate transport system permease protein
MSSENLYPEGEAFRAQISRRHRWGSVLRTTFVAATIVAIIALTALLYNVVNQAFGLVAVQNQVTPESLVLAFEEEWMLGADNVVASEDDDELAQGVTETPNGIGFFGYAFYKNHSDELKLLSVDGVTPSAETTESGEYPLARPLYIYTTEEFLANNQAVSSFINYYLTHVGEEIEEVGYFPVSSETLSTSQLRWLEATGRDPSGGQWVAVNPNGLSGNISIAGSSTVFPLTQRMAEQFQAAGFEGEIAVESIGSTAGLRRFCLEGNVDIANASRPITQAEREACRALDREPVEIRVGTDALAVVVNPANEAVDNVTLPQLQQIFTTADAWADVEQSWPAEPIARFIPGADSGTLDFFAESVFELTLADLPKDVLVNILIADISQGLGRRLEREQRFYEDELLFEDPELFAEVCASEEPPEGCTLSPRSQENVYQLVVERVVEQEVLQTWSLVDSLFNQSEILATVQRKHPNAEIEFRSWLTPEFIISPQSSDPELAGVRTAILGSLWVILITLLFSFPIGVGAAIYLEEYATENRINRIIQTNINNLAGVPSIIYGMLGLAIFVRMLEALSSGAVFGAVDAGTTANGRTIISAGLTLGLLILPIIIIASQEAIRAVPSSLRQASFGLGATKWQTIWYHVLPNALPGVLTGAILSMSRAIGETAPLVVVGASTFITVDPSGPFSKFTVLPIQIYQWTSRPQDEFRNIAAAAIIVLLVLLLTMNATAVLLRNRYSKELT